MNHDPKTLLKRVLWLAFQASRPVGMGFLHTAAASQQTEDTLFESAKSSHKEDTVYTDYLFGRMMKTTFEIKDGVVVVSPNEPRYDYQSWGDAYETGTALIEAAIKSLGNEK